MRGFWTASILALLAGWGCGDDASEPASEPLADTVVFVGSDADIADDTVTPPADTSPDTTPDTTHDVQDVEVDTGPYNPFDDPRPTAVHDPGPAPVPVQCPTVVNGAAESGDLTGWTVVQGTFQAQQHTDVFNGNFPEAHEGTYYFRAGDSSTSVLEQRITLDAPIDSTNGERIADLTVWMRNKSGRDEAFINLAALDAGGQVIVEREYGPFTHNTWQQRRVALSLPEGSAAVRLRLRGERKNGNKNNVYFDLSGLCIFDTPPRASAVDLHSPPYLMSGTESGVTVLFETRTSTTASIHYGASPEALDNIVSDPAATSMHELRLEGLQPGSRTFYQVRFEDMALPVSDFLTSPEPTSTERVEFVMFADNQDGPDNFRILSDMMAALDPDFILHAGDCVQNGTRGEYREQFFQPFYPLGSGAPIFIGAGNHETYSSTIITSNEARRLFNEYVAQPGDEHCFGWRHGPLFVMVIDTERSHIPGSDQYNCIRDALLSDAAQTATFRTAIFHRSPLIEYWDSVAGFPSPVSFFTAAMDAPDVTTHLAPMFEARRVHLVFNGHNHLYQYVPKWPQSVAWVTSGGGGGGLESGVPSSKVQDFSDYIAEQIFGEFHFLHGIIDQDVMVIRAVAMDGVILHEFRVEP